VSTPRLETGIDYVVLGLGMGCLMQLMSLIAQNSVDLKDQGVASSARMFFQQMGGSLGVAAFGAIFARKLESAISAAGAATGGAHLQISGGSFNPAQVASMPPAMQHVIFEGVAHGVSSVFVAVLPAAVLVFVLALFIKDVPLRTRGEASGNEAPVAEAEALIG